jgi:hypothetical protein
MALNLGEGADRLACDFSSNPASTTLFMKVGWASGGCAGAVSSRLSDSSTRSSTNRST